MRSESTTPETSLDSTGPEEGLAGARKRIISVFVALFFIFWSLLVLGPPESRRYSIVGGAGRVFRAFGLLQRMTPFAPTIPHTNVTLLGVVDCSDGSTRLWEFPRLDHLSMRERFMRGLWQKVPFLYCNPGRKESRPLLLSLGRHLRWQLEIAGYKVESISWVLFYSTFPGVDKFVRRSDLPEDARAVMFFVDHSRSSQP